MKFTISFKTPDATSYMVQELEEGGFDRDEIAEAEALAEKFIRNDEYVNIEFDTETGEAKVLPVED